MLTEATTERYLATIRRRLRRLDTHPQWEDIEREAVLAALVALDRLPEVARESADALVWRASGWGAANFLRSPRNETRRRNGSGGFFLARVELDALKPGTRDVLMGVEPDFAPRVIRQLYARQVWAEFWPLLGAADRTFLRRFLEEGATAAWAAEAQRSQGALYRHAQRILNRYRRRVGEPLYRDNLGDKEPVEFSTLLLSPEDAELAFFTWFRDSRTGQVYRPRQEGGQGQKVFLAWEVIARRDARAPSPTERSARVNADLNDYRRENLRRLTLNEYRAAWKRRGYGEQRQIRLEQHRRWYAKNAARERDKQRRRDLLKPRQGGPKAAGEASGPVPLSPATPTENARGLSP